MPLTTPTDVAVLLKRPPTYTACNTTRLQETLRSSPIIGPAQNAILFLGDGMSIETGTAARIRKGQLAGGGGRSCPPACGEESLLSWEAFDAVGLSKTCERPPTPNPHPPRVQEARGHLGVSGRWGGGL